MMPFVASFEYFFFSPLFDFQKWEFESPQNNRQSPKIVCFHHREQIIEENLLKSRGKNFMGNFNVRLITSTAWVGEDWKLMNKAFNHRQFMHKKKELNCQLSHSISSPTVVVASSDVLHFFLPSHDSFFFFAFLRTVDLRFVSSSTSLFFFGTGISQKGTERKNKTNCWLSTISLRPRQEVRWGT